MLILHLLLKGHKVGLLLGPFCLLLSKKVHHPSWRLLLASSGAVLGIVVVHSGCFLIDELLETFPESLVSCRGAPRLGKTEVERCGGGVVQTRIDTLEVSYKRVGLVESYKRVGLVESYERVALVESYE